MHGINIGLDESTRQKSVVSLEQYLADCMVLQVKTQGFHWNVESSDFGQLHALFQSQYEDLFAANDETAERIRILGDKVIAQMQRFSEISALKKVPETDFSDHAMLTTLIRDHEHCAQYLRAQITSLQPSKDEGTIDYFITRLQVHEKTAWVLRSHIV